MPQPRIEIILDKRTHLSERKAYTFFTLIGDLGGFYGAIVILPSLFMNWYSSKMFQVDIVGSIPHKRSKSVRQMPYKQGEVIGAHTASDLSKSAFYSLLTVRVSVARTLLSSFLPFLRKNRALQV